MKCKRVTSCLALHKMAECISKRPAWGKSCALRARVGGDQIRAKRRVNVQNQMQTFNRVVCAKCASRQLLAKALATLVFVVRATWQARLNQFGWLGWKCIHGVWLTQKVPNPHGFTRHIHKCSFSSRVFHRISFQDKITGYFTAWS